MVQHRKVETDRKHHGILSNLMSSDSREKQQERPKARMTATSLNSFRPLSQCDLDELKSASQVPSSIPVLQSGLIAPITNGGGEAGRVEVTASVSQNAADSPQKSGQ
jgi:hypothetical protein